MIITVVGIQEAHYCLGTGRSVNRMEKMEKEKKNSSIKLGDCTCQLLHD